MKILVFVAFLNLHHSYQNFQDLVFSIRIDRHKISIKIKTACISVLVNKYPELGKSLAEMFRAEMVYRLRNNVQCTYALLPIPTTMFKGVTIY